MLSANEAKNKGVIAHIGGNAFGHLTIYTISTPKGQQTAVIELSTSGVYASDPCSALAGLKLRLWSAFARVDPGIAAVTADMDCGTTAAAWYCVTCYNYVSFSCDERTGYNLVAIVVYWVDYPGL
jgi:hypothetical protein